MNYRVIAATLYAGLLSGMASAQVVEMTGYRPQPGLAAVAERGSLAVTWDGERGQELHAGFSIVDGTPTIKELKVRKKGGEWTTLGRDLVPEFGVTTGIRRTGHGLDHERRWDVFWDAPLNHPEEVRRSDAAFHSDRIEVRTDGARLEVSSPGLSMGPFSGGVRFTVYRGTNLLRVEAVARTDEPSVAYIYRGGLRGLSSDFLPHVRWRGRFWRRDDSSSDEVGKLDVLRARNRLATVGGKDGSVAVFPPPHQFFFARELEVNLGYVWHRRDGGKTFSLGVRQGENAEGYNPTWAEKVFSLYNAPPGTRQRMPVYFYLSADGPHACREAALAYTHGDRYKPLPGYKTLVTHFHTAFTQELIESGNLDTTPPWIPMMRDLGVNIAHIFDFHGDGHSHDSGPIRLKELETYFEGCRRHSDAGFLILPGEEANAYLGGHYNILFPKPVYWTMVRAKGQPLVEADPKYGKVYHAGSRRPVGDDEAGGCPGLDDPPPHQGLDRLPRQDQGRRLLPQRPLAGGGVQGAAGGPVAEAAGRGPLLRDARRHEQLGRAEVHGGRGGHVQEVPRLRPVRRLQRERRQARPGAGGRGLEPDLPGAAGRGVLRHDRRDIDPQMGHRGRRWRAGGGGGGGVDVPAGVR